MNNTELMNVSGMSASNVKLETVKNGNLSVTYYNAKGEECNAILADKEQASNVSNLVRFDELRKLGAFAVCYELALAEKSKVYETLGFSDVKAFARSFADIEGKTCGQYIRIGKIFMTATGEGSKRKYDLISPYLKGTSVSNLNQCLSLVEGDDTEAGLKFVADYVESGLIPITATLAMVKKAMLALKKSPEVIGEQEVKEVKEQEQEQDKEQNKEQDKEQAGAKAGAGATEDLTVSDRKATIDGAIAVVRKELLALLGKKEKDRIEKALMEVVRMYDYLK